MYCERKFRHDCLLNAFLAIQYFEKLGGLDLEEYFLAELAIFKIVTVQHQTRYYLGYKKRLVFLVS